MSKSLHTDASSILSQNDAFVANDKGVAFYGLDGTADAILGVLEQKADRYINNCADKGCEKLEGNGRKTFRISCSRSPNFFRSRNSSTVKAMWATRSSRR